MAGLARSQRAYETPPYYSQVSNIVNIAINNSVPERKDGTSCSAAIIS
jgi:hypothetical protein